MAKRGPKPKSEALKIVGGTDRPDRQGGQAFPELGLEVQLPAAYEGLRKERPEVAKRVLGIWNRKLEIYGLRGQDVAGYESALYQYCLLENILNDHYQAGAIPPQAMINGHRVYCNEFYDTSASNVAGGSAKGANPFANNGKPGKPRRS